MLKNVPVTSVKVSSMGGFQGSELNKFELEYLLAHIVRMSQEKGEWVTRFTISEYLETFKPIPVIPVNYFGLYFQMLLEKEYLVESDPNTFEVTKKFAELCIKFAE